MANMAHTQLVGFLQPELAIGLLETRQVIFNALCAPDVEAFKRANLVVANRALWGNAVVDPVADSRPKYKEKQALKLAQEVAKLLQIKSTTIGSCTNVSCTSRSPDRTECPCRLCFYCSAVPEG